MRTTFTIALLTASFAAGAQVYKCPKPGGGVAYSDTRCAADAQAMDPSRLRGSSLGPAIAPRRQVDVERPAPPQRQIEDESPTLSRRDAPQQQAVGTTCPSERDIRNLETSASSVTLGRKEREFLYAEIRRARACSKEGGNYSAEDWQRIKDHQAGQNRIDERDRARERALAEGRHAPAASDRENERMRNDKMVEAIKEAGRRRRTATLTTCDAAGCWDAAGQRYNRAAGPGNFFRQDGAPCRAVGNQVDC